jgi:hypothetical protein
MVFNSRQFNATAVSSPQLFNGIYVQCFVSRVFVLKVLNLRSQYMFGTNEFLVRTFLYILQHNYLRTMIE